MRAQTEKLAIAVAFVNNYERARSTVRRLCAENSRFAELAKVCSCAPVLLLESRECRVVNVEVNVVAGPRRR